MNTTNVSLPPPLKCKPTLLNQIIVTLRRKNQNNPYRLDPYVLHPTHDDTPPPPPPPPKDKDHHRTLPPFLPVGDDYINEKSLMFDLDLRFPATTEQLVLPSQQHQPSPILSSIPSPSLSPIPSPSPSPSPSPPQSILQPQPTATHTPTHTETPPRVPVKTKAHSPIRRRPTKPPTPEEKARRRVAAQRESELERETMLREEHERQEIKRWEKLEQERVEREEEAVRRAILQEEVRAASLRKARVEREEREREEGRVRDLRERKVLEKERRLRYTKELERWRAEHVQLVESRSSEKEEERRRSAEGRRVRISRLNEEVFSAGNTGEMVGWVTVQAPDVLAWKRRYYSFELGHGTGSKMMLYRNPREIATAMDVLPLNGRVDSLAEWYEGFEELEAIPHSFAVRFVDGVEWRMFADSPEEKDRLLVLLSEAAGITV